MKTIKINIPEGYVIDTEKSTFEEIVFKPISNKVKCWEDLKNVKGYFINNNAVIKEADCPTTEINKAVFPTKEYAEAALALAQLLQLRQAWIGDWTLDWNNDNISKWVIISKSSVLIVDFYYTTYSAVSFPTEEMANDFLNTFKDLLETAKPLL